MTVADDHMPLVVPDLQTLVILETTIRIGKGMYHPAEPAELRLVDIDFGGIPTGGVIEAHTGAGRGATRIASHETAGEILQLAHPQCHFESLREPTGHTTM